MKFGTDTLAQAIQAKLTRNILLVAALMISTTAYFYVVEFWGPNANLLRQVWRGIFGQSYTLHSGSEGGFYVQVGKLLEKETAGSPHFRIYNRKSSGGFENAVAVAGRSSALGLLQEDTLAENDSLRRRLRFVTPLYLERMHILYRYDPNCPNPILSPHDPSAKQFFQKTKAISTGPHGSGSRIFAGYLLSQCRFHTTNDRNLPFKEALAELQADNLQAVFTIAGAPLRHVREILKNDPNVRLMSVDPALVPELNRVFGLRLRPTTFKDIYTGGERVSTIGSCAFLAASKDVPNSAIMKLPFTLDRSKHKMEGYNEYASFPLDEFNFVGAFEKEYKGFRMELLRNVFVFLISIVGTTAVAMSFLVWIASEYKEVGYFREITILYDDFLPRNSNLDERNGAFPRPIINDNQSEIVSALVRGIARLLLLSQKIRRDYESGGLTMTHYRHLLDNLYEMKDIFQRNLAQRLREVLEQKAVSPQEFHALLRCYYTAGYLTHESYGDLRAAAQTAAE